MLRFDDDFCSVVISFKSSGRCAISMQRTVPLLTFGRKTLIFLGPLKPKTFVSCSCCRIYCQSDWPDSKSIKS